MSSLYRSLSSVSMSIVATLLRGVLLLETLINDRLLAKPREWSLRLFWASYKPLIVLSVLGLSAAVIYRVPGHRIIFLVGTIPAIGAIYILLRQPALGIIALLVTALFVPTPVLPGGLNYAVLLLFFLIVLWLFDGVILKGGLSLSRSRVMWPLLALVLASIIAFGIGQLPWFIFAPQAPIDTQIGGLFIFLLAIGGFLITAHQIRELKWLQYLTWLFIGAGFIFLLGWLVPFLGFIGQYINIGATANSMFWTWLVALAFSQAIFNRDLHLGWRLFLLVVVACTLYVGIVLNNDWKSGYMPPLVVLAAVIGTRSMRLAAGIGLLSIGPTVYLINDAVATDTYSYSTRVDAWLIMWEMIKTNPITGFGPANYHFYTPLFRIRGYAVRFNSHNQYIDIIAQIGFLGMACFVWFAWEMFVLAWQLKDKAPAGFAQAYVYGVLGGLAGTLFAGALADWFFPFPYNIGFFGFQGAIIAWLFLGGIVVIERLVRQQIAEENPVSIMHEELT